MVLQMRGLTGQLVEQGDYCDYPTYMERVCMECYEQFLTCCWQGVVVDCVLWQGASGKMKVLQAL